MKGEAPIVERHGLETTPMKRQPADKGSTFELHSERIPRSLLQGLQKQPCRPNDICSRSEVEKRHSSCQESRGKNETLKKGTVHVNSKKASIFSELY